MPKTTEASLTDLLNEWAELEPGRCRTDDGFIWVDSFGEHNVVVERNHVGEWTHRHGWKGFVQAAVQEAIEAKGWDLRLKTGVQWHPESGATYTYFAKVSPAEDETYRGEGYPPAHALLAAYLTALRSQNE